MDVQNRISCILVKIASRCNLDCDYCYMYHHVDQSWRKMPAFLSEENEDHLAFRIAEYLQATHLPRLLIVYHGGEPLLIGIEALERITKKIRASVPAFASIDFSLQTNGTLLTKEILDRLEVMNISVSLSIDGPENIHDKHRSDHSGKASFAKVEVALKMLIDRPKVFTGVISVIDPFFDPKEVLEYFNQFSIPSLDILLPDANYNRLPPGRDKNPSLYTDWLIKCFDLWFDEFAGLRIRFFDSILDSIVGLPSCTDALGFGDVTLLTIETDGTYHDLDVLKIAYDGATDLHQGDLATQSIEDASKSVQINNHRNLLKKEGLCKKCQVCDIVDTCAGGAVPHRFSNEGFSNPSIYCNELLALVTHAKRRLTQQLQQEVEASKPQNNLAIGKDNLMRFEDADYSYELLQEMISSWGGLQTVQFKGALQWAKKQDESLATTVNSLLVIPEDQFRVLSIQPSVYAWTNVMNANSRGEVITSIDGVPIPAEFRYVNKIASLLNQDFDVQRINREDNWLRVPFGEKIKYEEDGTTSHALKILDQAYALIDGWNNKLLREIKLIAPELQFIKDSTAHPDKIVSFSDNSVPGALYVTILLGDKFIDAADLADSILHEYRHQKLYLLQRISDVISIDVPLVPSPWREELRPPSGLYHALYVFTFLKKFWKHLSVVEQGLPKRRAEEEVEAIAKKIEIGISTVRQTRLTKTGFQLLEILESEMLQKAK